MPPLITASPMSTALPGMALRVLQRLANAQLDIGAASVFGLLNDEPDDVALGSMAVQARRKTFVAMTADLDATAGAAAIGTACTLLGSACVIAQRSDHPQTGQTTLQLERA